MTLLGNESFGPTKPRIIVPTDLATKVTEENSRILRKVLPLLRSL